MHVPRFMRQLTFESCGPNTVYVNDEVEEIGWIQRQSNGTYYLSVICLDSVSKPYVSLRTAKAALRKIYNRWVVENEDRESAEPVRA